ncbi:hypothetical protein [Kitasatospora sp. NPDC101183]|uniref:hypothetical protein n=1 Tax=Kitasatospora sp. NPDC101183 TaxID=3364100 RepID=UPI00381B3CFD
MALFDPTPEAQTSDYTPAVWPEPVRLVPRKPLDPLGTVLIPPAERQPAVAAPAPFPFPFPPPVDATAAPLPPPSPVAAAAPRRRLALPRGGEARRRQLVERIRTPLRICHRIAVVGGGGAGVAAVLGGVLAEHRADGVIVLDPSGPGAGDVRNGRLLLRSLPAGSDYRGALAEAVGQFPVVLTDATGAPELASAADQVLICEPASADGARDASAHLDRLGPAAVLLFTPAPPGQRAVPGAQLVSHFTPRCRAALTLATPASLRPRDRHGYLEAAALIGDTMAGRHPA